MWKGLIAIFDRILHFNVQAGNRALRSFFFHSVDTATGVDGHLRSHRLLLMEWSNNSWIYSARCRFRAASCSPFNTVPLHARIFSQIHPTRLYGFGRSVVSVDCHWCPMATTTVWYGSMNIHLPFVRKAFAVVRKGSRRERGDAKGQRDRGLTKEQWWAWKREEIW